MDALPNGVLDLAEHVVVEVTILRLQEADIVWGVDDAIACHLDREFIGHISLNILEEVAEHLLVLVLHLHVIDFRYDNGVIVAALCAMKQTTTISVTEFMIDL